MYFNIIDIIYFVIIWAVSVWLHEYAHAASSFKLWDPTPKLQNRLTPNPLAHIDPIWFLMIFLVNFWRGKPVLINPSYYKNPLRDELIVALSGPFTNFMLAIFGIVFLLCYIRFGLGIVNPIDVPYDDMIIRFWMLFSEINVWLAIFNLVPVPPLDWFTIFKYFFPRQWIAIERNPLYTLLWLFAALRLFKGIVYFVETIIFGVLFGLFANIIF